MAKTKTKTKSKDKAKEKEIKTIDVLIDDDVNIIVDQLRKADQDKVIVSIPEGNDLLTSEIGLKLLNRTADKLGKKLVIKTSTASSQKFVSGVGLLTAQDETEAESKLSDEPKSVAPPPTAQPKTKTINAKSAPAFSMKIDDGTEATLAGEKSSISLNNHSEASQSSASYSEKAPFLKESNQNNQAVANSDTKVGGNKVDSRVARQVPENKEQAPFVNYDFAHGMPAMKNVATSKMTLGGGSSGGGKSGIGNFLAAAGRPLGKILRPFRRTGLKILILLLIPLAIGAFVYYQYFPKLRIVLTQAAEPVQMEEAKVTAVTSLTGFDTEQKQIQLIKETATKTGSTNITASGTEYTGEKATGVVTLYNANEDAVTVPAKAELTTNGLSFVTNQEVEVPPKIGDEEGTASVGVTAAAIGEEYNVEVNTTFAVEGILGVSGQNQAAFTGGTKQKKTVIDKEKDVDKAVKELEKQLYAEAQADIESQHGNDGFVFISESVKNKTVGDPKIDPPIGSETEEAYLEVKVETTALFYHEPSLEKLLEVLLQDEYRAQAEEEENAEIEIDSFQSDITKIEVSEDGKVTITAKASGRVVPQINQVELEAEIREGGWQEMKKKLNDLSNLQKDPQITFYPEWMPEFLYYVPKQDARVEIDVRVVEE